MSNLFDGVLTSYSRPKSVCFEVYVSNLFFVFNCKIPSTMAFDDVSKLTEDLERQELEAPNGVAAPQVYEKLLAIYLYQNDLCNAKYLWKRIPPNVKSSTPELTDIWAVGQSMWKRDFPAIYKALNAVTWSDTVADIMKQLQDIIRSRSVELIAQAYSSITLDNVSAMTGLSPDICIPSCAERGWKYEADTKMVHPIRQIIEPIGQPSNEDQLYKLTDFVSFLEN